jgi:uncharacterized membrane protein
MSNGEKITPKDKGPILIPKSSGLGWTLNFERPESYWILGIVIVIAVAYLLIKKKAIKL